MSEPTAELPGVTPSVTTAPARSRWSKVPAHLGRARTSTVVLGVLFLLIGTLYLNIRPPEAATTGTTSGVSDQQPARTTTPAAPPTADTTTPEPTTTGPEPTTEEPTPTETTTEPTETATDEPTDEPTDTDAPSSSVPTAPGTGPTRTAPTTTTPSG